MIVEVVMPKMGESIQEGRILRWLKKVGEQVKKDETILEISTDKVDSEIPSPAGGILTKIVANENDTVPVGTVIASIETEAGASAASSVDTAPPKAEPAVEPHASAPAVAPPPPVVESTKIAVPPPLTPAPKMEIPAERGREGVSFYSPLVRSIAEKENIPAAELAAIVGTGAGGRITKNDLVAYIERRNSGIQAALSPSHVPSAAQVSRAASLYFPWLEPADANVLKVKYPAPKFEVVQMDNVQRKMAEHMVRSMHVSPHVAAISEVDLTKIVEFRAKTVERFERQEGFKLTYTHFIVSAVVGALKEFPLVNSSIEGDKIVYKNFINLGVAVASPAGLIVPVIKGAEEKNFIGLARSLNDIASRARDRKLQPDDILGGTFTITNYGVFGNIIGTPVINQPQVAILGTGAIKKRPMVITNKDGDDMIAIRSMAYFTLSFDHRVIDGEIGGKFLQRIVENLEQFDVTKVM